MSTPEWIAYALTAVSVSTIVAAVVYVWCRDPDKDKYCSRCQDVTTSRRGTKRRAVPRVTGRMNDERS